MRTKTEHNPTYAQLTLHYQLYQEELPVTSAAQASELFLQFSNSIDVNDG